MKVKSTVSYDALPKGRLAFVVLPWAEVSLGKEVLGSTPMRAVDVVEGSYRVVLKLKDQTVVKRVRVKARQETVVKHDFRK